MQDKKSKFDTANTKDEGKEEVKTTPQKHHPHETKKNFDFLQVHVARPSEIHKWQEIRISANLPERRSHACSCIYKNSY